MVKEKVTKIKKSRLEENTRMMKKEIMLTLEVGK